MFWCSGSPVQPMNNCTPLLLAITFSRAAVLSQNLHRFNKDAIESVTLLTPMSRGRVGGQTDGWWIPSVTSNKPYFISATLRLHPPWRVSLVSRGGRQSRPFHYLAIQWVEIDAAEPRNSSPPCAMQTENVEVRYIRVVRIEWRIRNGEWDGERNINYLPND